MTVIGRVTEFTVGSRLKAFRIERPTDGHRSETFELPIVGWLSVQGGAPAAVEIRGHGNSWSLSLTPGSEVSSTGDSTPTMDIGFRGNVNVLRLPSHFQLTLFVVFHEGLAVPAAQFQGSRDTLEPTTTSRLQPLLLHCLGRSGSTWTSHLLGQHPEIVTYEPFRFEPRMVGYWLDILAALSEPASYAQSLQPEAVKRDWWLGRNRQTALAVDALGPEMARWMGHDAITSVASFCLHQADQFYCRVADEQGKRGARFFVERGYGIGSFAPRMARELYAGIREIFLVRDFRDVFCSMRAFRGKTLPRRQMAIDDEGYIRNQLRDYMMGLYRAWMECKDRAFLLRYEDLVGQPVEALNAAFRYVGVEASERTVEEVMKRATETRTKRQRQHRTSSDAQSSIGRWQRELEPGLCKAFSDAMGEALAEFGYLPRAEKERMMI